MRYVDFTKDGKKLLISLLPEAKQDFEEVLQSTKSWTEKVSEVLEEQLTNGWTWLSASDIGALTSDYESTLLSDDVEEDEMGIYTHIGMIYWYPEYEVTDFLEELLRYGEVTFTGVD